MNTSLIWQTTSTSPADTEKLGELIGKGLKGGEVIELRSDLGGGKTTLVRGLVHGAGSPDPVRSPTFTLSRIYQAQNFEIHHFDFYRLNNPGLLADQLAESIENNNVVVIEWADIISNVLPDERLAIELRPVVRNPEERQITISYPLATEELIKAVETNWQESRP